jgi:DNA transformation protein
MPVSAGYQTFVLDQLRRVVPSVRARRMFGAVGLYSGDLFFALIDDDVLYLKVDDATRPDFEALGMKPFQPYGDGTTSMNYQQLPEDVLEDVDSLRQWSGRALDVARRAKVKPKRNARSKPASTRKRKPKS